MATRTAPAPPIRWVMILTGSSVLLVDAGTALGRESSSPGLLIISALLPEREYLPRAGFAMSAARTHLVKQLIGHLSFGRQDHLTAARWLALVGATRARRSDRDGVAQPIADKGISLMSAVRFMFVVSGTAVYLGLGIMGWGLAGSVFFSSGPDPARGRTPHNGLRCLLRGRKHQPWGP
jgi:hypothetical protein